MSNTKQWEAELNQMIASGKGFPDGFDKFYADDVVMMEGNGESYQGKEVNRKREIEFFGSVQQVHSIRCIAAAADGDVGFSEWEFDVTFKGGKRMKLEQVARRRWKNGKIIHERFYYNPGAMT
jgi:ketosteroid isomerase-like protein